MLTPQDDSGSFSHFTTFHRKSDLLVWFFFLFKSFWDMASPLTTIHGEEKFTQQPGSS